MPDKFETDTFEDTLLSPPGEPGVNGAPAPESSAAPELPESPEAYALGLEEFLGSDESLSGLQIDQALEDDFRKTSHLFGLGQEAAGELARMYARHQARLAEEGRARQSQAIQDMEAAWISELKADKDLPAQLSRARTAIKTYGSPELVGVLEETRLGSHPAFVRFMARVGQALAEPSFAQGSSANEDKSPAEILYPNQNKL